jgi:hypothetical protein
MVTDHMGSNKQATMLVQKLKVKPEDSPTSESLKDDHKVKEDQLNNVGVRILLLLYNINNKSFMLIAARGVTFATGNPALGGVCPCSRLLSAFSRVWRRTSRL